MQLYNLYRDAHKDENAYQYFTNYTYNTLWVKSKEVRITGLIIDVSPKVRIISPLIRNPVLWG